MVLDSGKGSQYFYKSNDKWLSSCEARVAADLILAQLDGWGRESFSKKQP